MQQMLIYFHVNPSITLRWATPFSSLLVETILARLPHATACKRLEFCYETMCVHYAPTIITVVLTHVPCKISIIWSDFSIPSSYSTGSVNFNICAAVQLSSMDHSDLWTFAISRFANTIAHMCFESQTLFDNYYKFASPSSPQTLTQRTPVPGWDG